MESHLCVKDQQTVNDIDIIINALYIYETYLSYYREPVVRYTLAWRAPSSDFSMNPPFWVLRRVLALRNNLSLYVIVYYLRVVCHPRRTY